MKRHLITLSLALSLATVAANANVLPGSASAGYDTGSVSVPQGPFLTDWSFSLPGGSALDVNAFQIKFNQIYNLTGTTLELFKGNIGGGTAVGGAHAVTQNTNGFTIGNLVTGNYYFQIAGLANGVKGGKYELQAVSACPEPGVEALLGLGVVGILLLRRKSSGSFGATFA